MADEGTPPIATVEQAARRLGWIEGKPVRALYVSAGADTQPFSLLHPDFLAKQTGKTLPAPTFFIYVDQDEPQPQADPRLSFSDERTQIETVSHERLAGSLPADLLRVRLASDQLSEREVTVARLRMLNEDFATLAWEERWQSQWFIGVCDGCGGFGGNTRCENDITDPERSIPLRLGARWWVTDHVPGSDAPTTRVRARET